MTLDYAQHYHSIRELLLDTARVDRTHAIDTAHRCEREAFGALSGLAAEVEAALLPAHPTTTERASRANTLQETP